MILLPTSFRYSSTNVPPLGIPNAFSTVSSVSYVTTENAFYEVAAIGAGGSGAVYVDASTLPCASGGGAGGFSKKTMFLPANTTLTITIGAGGAARSTSTNAVGLAGGNTSVSCPYFSLLARGGAGGSLAQVSTGAALGGKASGGDVNYTGGGSGACSTGGSLSCASASGGGAVGIYATGFSSGGALNVVVADSQACATGGAGTGSSSSTLATGTSSSGGGSALLGTGTVSFLSLISGVGGAIGGANVTIPGAGSGGSITSSKTGTSGDLAGTGGFANTTSVVTAGNTAGIGGGSGGLASAGSGTAANGAGGSGCVFITWVKA